MSHGTSTSASYWREAKNLFEYAIANGQFNHDVSSLSFVGRAVLSTTNEQDHVVPEAFGKLLLQHPNVVRRATAVLGVLAEMYGSEMIAQILYARSGYQVLLDAGLWAEPPVDPAEVVEVDEAICEKVQTVEFPADERRPKAVPPGHDWWSESLRGPNA
jgi:hypothetical protein